MEWTIGLLPKGWINKEFWTFFSGCKDLKVDDYNSKRKEAEKYTSLGCDVDEEKGSKNDTRKWSFKDTVENKESGSIRNGKHLD